VISGNSGSGIILLEAGTKSNVVAGNYIGLNPAGTAALRNNLTGVEIGEGALQNRIGGTRTTTGCDGPCNVISGNGQSGVLIWGMGSDANLVQGNFIGTNATGTARIANEIHGIHVTDSVIVSSLSVANQTLAGQEAASMAQVSQRRAYQVEEAAQVATTIARTPAAEESLISPQQVAGGRRNNQIGGDTPRTGNLISGNALVGIALQGVDTQDTLIWGNHIGSNQDGNDASLGNGTVGIQILEASATMVGGADAANGNTIAYNGAQGVYITDAAAISNTIRHNSIHHNASLGITIENGAQSGIKPPGLLVSTTRAKGMGAPPNAIIDVYIVDQDRFSNSADGHGEGMIWVGSGTADGNGHFDFAITGVSEDDLLTATATDTAGSTSQFSYQPLLTALEVTQAIQRLRNSVLLVEEKPTFLRAHIGAVPPGFGLEGTVVLGELVGRNSGGELAGSPLAIANKGGSITLKEFPHRVMMDDSFLFELPAAWRNGNAELEFRNLAFRCGEAANTGDNGEPATAFNDCRTGVLFQEASTPDVLFVPLAWEDANGSRHIPDQTDFQNAAKELEATFPIRHLDWRVHTAPLTLPKAAKGAPITVDAFTEWIYALKKFAALQGNQGYYVGILDNQPQARPIVMGQADLGGKVAVSYINGLRTLSHEVGHLANRRHTDCGTPVTAADPAYPYADGKISPVIDGPEAFYGFDIRTKPPTYSWDLFSTTSERIRFPWTGDLMSYCQPTWPSDWTYRHIREYLLTRFGPSAAATEAATLPLLTNASAILVSGIISPSTNAGAIDPLYSVDLPSPLTLPEPGEYTLRFENSQGQVLTSHNFEPSTLSDEVDAIPFVLTLPPVAGAARVLLLHDDLVLDVRTASANVPSVTVLAPNGGETLSGATTTLSWSATDADGDPLRYTVQYSPDGGSSWQSLVTDWLATTYELDLTWLIGTEQGQIRVLATDGFHTAQDTSDATFSVAGHAPHPLIESPVAEQIFVGEQMVHFKASAYDSEEGLLGDTALSWMSDRDGALGAGRTLEVVASSLSEGTHTITLSAEDSDGSIATANVAIQVHRLRPVFPPRLAVSPAFFPAVVETGGAQVETQLFSVRNEGDGALAWTASADQTWIELSATSGSAPGDFSVTLNPSGLPVGEHTGTILVTAPGAANSPQSVVVLLRVTAPGASGDGSPEPNSHNAPLETNISASYAKALDPASVGLDSFVAHSLQSGRVAGDYSVDGAQIMLIPSHPFRPGEIVYVSSTSAIRYLSGSEPVRPFVWQFQIQPPTVSAGIFNSASQEFMGAMDAALGDLDGDGDLDVFTLRRFREESADEGSIVLFNQGDGTLMPGEQIIPMQGISIVEPTSAVALGDLDNDGDLDLFVIAANQAQPPQGNIAEIQIWFNNGSGRFTDSGQHLPFASGGGYRTSLGDLDGDGDLDALVSEISQVTLWRNTGAGVFAESQVIEAINSHWTLGDVDGDGDLDAFVVSASNFPYELWLNDGQGTFADSGQRLGISNSSEKAALGDVDGDGDLDAVVAERGNSSQVWLNRGGNQGGQMGVFSDSVQLPAGLHSDVKLVDIDGDGDLDAIFDTNSMSSEIWRNNGNGVFTRRGELGLDKFIVDSFFGDLDGNGTVDAFIVYPDAGDKAAPLLNNIRTTMQQNRLYAPVIGRAGTSASSQQRRLYLQWIRPD
jgi:hypothetical protein